jgi:hypothetical protein
VKDGEGLFAFVGEINVCSRAMMLVICVYVMGELVDM